MEETISGCTGRGLTLLLALNPNPDNPVGQRFDTLLKKHLNGAWRMTCLPLSGTGAKGEGRYRAEVILAARFPRERGTRHRNVAEPGRRLDGLAGKLAGILDLSGCDARVLVPEVIGGHEGDDDRGRGPVTSRRPDQRA